MADDLNINPNTSTLLSSLFFLGYFFFQIPGAHYAATRTAKKLIFISFDPLGRVGRGYGDGQ
jgi:hypothetical protein